MIFCTGRAEKGQGALLKEKKIERSEEMKKFLSTAVALGLVAGLAASASALELKVKGNYEFYETQRGVNLKTLEKKKKT